jgi:hypothetical protein
MTAPYSESLSQPEPTASAVDPLKAAALNRGLGLRDALPEFGDDETVPSVHCRHYAVVRFGGADERPHIEKRVLELDSLTSERR